MKLILRFFLQVTSTVGFFQYFFAKEATQQLQDQWNLNISCLKKSHKLS